MTHCKLLRCAAVFPGRYRGETQNIQRRSKCPLTTKPASHRIHPYHAFNADDLKYLTCKNLVTSKITLPCLALSSAAPLQAVC